MPLKALMINSQVWFWFSVWNIVRPRPLALSHTSSGSEMNRCSGSGLKVCGPMPSILQSHYHHPGPLMPANYFGLCTWAWLWHYLQWLSLGIAFSLSFPERFLTTLSAYVTPGLCEKLQHCSKGLKYFMTWTITYNFLSPNPLKLVWILMKNTFI